MDDLKKIIVDGEEMYALPDTSGNVIFVSKEMAEELLKTKETK